MTRKELDEAQIFRNLCESPHLPSHARALVLEQALADKPYRLPRALWDIMARGDGWLTEEAAQALVSPTQPFTGAPGPGEGAKPSSPDSGVISLPLLCEPAQADAVPGSAGLEAPCAPPVLVLPPYHEPPHAHCAW